MIIGIDPSLTSTGISSAEHTGVIKSEPLDEPADFIELTIRRCDKIMDDIADWLQENCPLRVAYEFYIEGPSFGQARGASHLLEMGIWYGSFYRRFHGVPNTVSIVQPATLKKFIGGKGNLKKADVPLVAYKKWEVEFEHDAGRDKIHAFALYKLGSEVRGGTFDFATPKRRGKAAEARAAARTKRRNTEV